MSSTSHELAVQSTLFTPQSAATRSNTSVFTDNMRLPVHRWFRYSAGFSAQWVQDLILSQGPPSEARVLDPFVGSGTTVLAAQTVGAASMGLETHPLVARIAKAKLKWTEDPQDLLGRGAEALARAASSAIESSEVKPPLLAKIYSPSTLDRLYRLRQAISDLSTGSPVDDLVWLGLVSVLRACSPAGTAQWQYVLPNKTKAKSADPFEAFQAQIQIMAQDMAQMQSAEWTREAAILEEDARSCSSIEDAWATTIITSPPYPNNYDYADATRIEMTFLGEINGWGDLQEAVRKGLVHSCTQHMSGYKPEEALEAAILEPIREELEPVFAKLAEVRLTKGGRKAYHSMVVAYFLDLAETWHALRRVTAPGATVCFVVGDSAPYAVHVPVEKWLGELALAAGFKSYEFEKIRDRNIKWKNRKHRVPLHEGRLWLSA